ncbi:uncharacterized protein PHACADRAFT_251161 [Phanerochaete carnosa HHB-10118-sp]|uniref:Uncharacterized protein n=1 Tax=Phanerochaete carnosa (strain HHB-10118-sp) TaxID=650164 RepID=K5W0X9_PHACS|nr:uncharacterized protein PHACADRAFT_251161 [Phanerochaete carnosa HHB-10118-sp]EKM57488.1 hypothetical protein PHACADRAFT_251161 [Phanerochaete carnosa HHB-10118-sp]
MTAESVSIKFPVTPRSSIVIATPSAVPVSSSTSTPGASGGSSGFFSKTGSPALVLAFLAVGIFAGGLLSMLFLRHIGILRRIRQRQLAVATEAAPPGPDDPVFMSRRSRRRKPLGEKPKLWEYIHNSGRRSRNAWDGFVPIAVSSMQPIKISLPGSQPAARPFSRSMHRRRLDAVGRWIRGLGPRAPAPPASSPSNNIGALHLTVAITMPSQQRPKAGERPSVPIYELGLVDIPWTTDKFEALTSSSPSDAVTSGTP